mmetsp:Transcript_23724/g.49253  ORF Transcript_23724/g.49253 Transcript_23724/m.49253 type:complete len:321 (-) Transcript_23724:225-1187(-)|eukprot:CAMPEP_0172442660 /NCGR_PEP_ID=MMETSP1065-20121228/3058_1 /TAXON_ID=265537 /ORGANISM="Amphiprora paludosa, Strain CCMP125" /LENGTH=320 /DNA_ID=CAMNT_0013192615 /DNA_START=40 /DNA_END=1002 /DNA_ORIENTATION=+
MSSPAQTSNMHLDAVQVNMDYQSHERFPAWIALSVFSAICLAAFCSEIESKFRESEEKWCLAVYCISMIMAIFASVGYLLVRGIFVGTLFEIAMATVVIAFWGIGLPTMMKPDNAIAVAGNIILNANLYFFSWISFVVTIFLVMSLVREKLGVDVRQTPGKHMRWFFLVASSLVVMGSAVRIHKAESVECGNSESALHGSSFCKRTNFAISLGVSTFFFGLIIMFMLMKHLLATMIELGTTTILLILWTFGVGFVTFGGSDAPGATIGNLYFSTWISFILSLMLFGNSLQEFTSAGAAQETSASQEPNNENGLPQEEDDV